MDRLQALKVFVAVAEAGSFIGGARAAGVSGPSATRAVGELEEALGARLFIRTTRRVRLTDAGRDFAAEVQEILSHLRAAEEAVTGAAGTPAGLLRITAPQEFGRLHMAPLVAEFLEAFPEVRVELLLVDRMVNLVEEGHDLALRIGALPSSGLLALRVGEVRRVVCGARGYFARFGRPEAPGDLASGHRIVMTGSRQAEWKFGRDGRQTVRLETRYQLNSVAAALEVARRGWGLCRVLSYQVADDLEHGRLALALERWEPPPAPVHLVHPAGRRTPAKLRAFLDFAGERLRRLPALRPG